MNIDVSKIVSDKLKQLDADGVIKHKIEETLEKTVIESITSELSSYSFRKSISDQVKDGVSKVAADCGLSAYNGFIAQAVQKIIRDLYSADIANKVQKALDSVLLQKHENVSLSKIFSAYREWVIENTDEAEKYERICYTADLEVKEDGSFTWYTCRFADHPLESACFYGKERGEVEVRFCVYGERREAEISGLYLNGHHLKDSLQIGRLTDFEAFLVNLYYNEIEIVLDVENVDDDTGFDINN